MKKYNEKFDSGFTLRGDGIECEKDSQILEACGDIDEINSFLGLAKSFLEDGEMNEIITGLQKDLIILMSDITSEKELLTKNHVENIEKLIIKYEKNAKVNDWIIPGSSRAEAALHVARSVSRRAERSALKARRKHKVNFEILRYLNRLSDLIFILSVNITINQTQD